MGRSAHNGVPLEVVSASPAAVADQHIRSAIAQRDGRVREITASERASSARMAAADAWVASRPELCVDGEPCPWALNAALRYRASSSDMDDLAARVQAFRRRHLPRLAERGLLTAAEVEHMLGGAA